MAPSDDKNSHPQSHDFDGALRNRDETYGEPPAFNANIMRSCKAPSWALLIIISYMHEVHDDGGRRQRNIIRSTTEVLIHAMDIETFCGARNGNGRSFDGFRDLNWPSMIFINATKKERAKVLALAMVAGL